MHLLTKQQNSIHDTNKSKVVKLILNYYLKYLRFTVIIKNLTQSMCVICKLRQNWRFSFGFIFYESLKNSSSFDFYSLNENDIFIIYLMLDKYIFVE